MIGMITKMYGRNDLNGVTLHGWKQFNNKSG